MLYFNYLPGKRGFLRAPLNYLLISLGLFFALTVSSVLGFSRNHGVVPPRANFQIEKTPFKYSSYYCDMESGFHYCNSRYYYPKLMRFISRDTYDLSNRYAYADGDPVKNIDPTGHTPITLPAYVGLIINGASLLGSCSQIGYLLFYSKSLSVSNATVLAIIGTTLSGIVDLSFSISPDLYVKDSDTRNLIQNISLGIGIALLGIELATTRSILSEVSRNQQVKQASEEMLKDKTKTAFSKGEVTQPENLQQKVERIITAKNKKSEPMCLTAEQLDEKRQQLEQKSKQLLDQRQIERLVKSNSPPPLKKRPF